MAFRIKIPFNTNSGVVPTPSNLDTGELAINTADGRLRVKHNNGTMVLQDPKVL